ncbi:MAG: PD40 domain-containing protein [Bacteroidetes bacterium]|nr:PD40 domain-containing protein [Bacteroidota bacterium]
MKLKIFILFLINFISYNIIAQPLPDGKSNNKKANELFEKAMVQFDLMEYENAIQLLNSAIKKDPEFIDAYDLLGQVYIKTSNLKEAENTYLKLYEINNGYWILYYELGNITFDMMKYDSAKQWYSTFLKYRNIPEKEKLETEKQLKSCDFAKNAIKNPVKFSPVNLGDGINTQLSEYFPTLTADEQTMFFTFMDLRHQEDFFISTYKDGKWSEAVNLGAPINTPENEGASTISADGQYLFFTACQNPLNIGSCDLWLTFIKGDKWQQPIHMPDNVNSKYKETQPSLSADGKTLYFASNRPGGMGGMDIWKTTFEKNAWTNPVNLGSTINTPFDDECPFIHQDGITLYFASDGHPGMGARDLFFSKLKEDETWETPINLGYPINTPGNEEGLIINRSGTTGYFSSDIKTNPGHKGKVDIYSFEIPDKIKPGIASYVKGKVYDEETGQPIQTLVELTELSKNKIAAFCKSNLKTGNFLLVISGNKNYGLNVNAPGYLIFSENFSIRENPSSNPYLIDVPLKKIKPGKTFQLYNILFDINKSDLKTESSAELEKLYNLVNSNPKIKIEIGGHTDNSGSESLNLPLSQNRAKAVYDWLVTKGISKDRMTFKGYGSSVPLMSNDTPEGKRKNRRTEIKII